MKKNLLLVLILALAFISCAGTKEPLKTQSEAIEMLIISPLARINDSGFIHFSKGAILLQIYSAGASVLELKIADKICLNGACSQKSDFNQRFFGKVYYEKILEDIILSKPLAFGSKLDNECGGFSQRGSDFDYEVCRDYTIFKNARTKIRFSKK